MKATQTMTGDGWTLAVTVDETTATASIETLDPNWAGLDEHGHLHQAGNLGATCEARYGEPYWCEMHDEEHEDFLGWFCSLCGDRVTPGKVPPFTTFVVDRRWRWEATLRTATGSETWVGLAPPVTLFDGDMLDPDRVRATGMLTGMTWER